MKHLFPNSNTFIDPFPFRPTFVLQIRKTRVTRGSSYSIASYTCRTNDTRFWKAQRIVKQSWVEKTYIRRNIRNASANPNTLLLATVCVILQKVNKSKRALSKCCYSNVTEPTSTKKKLNTIKRGLNESPFQISSTTSRF